MDDVVNRFARELADAIAAAVAENPQVEACREKSAGRRLRDEGHARSRGGIRQPFAAAVGGARESGRSRARRARGTAEEKFRSDRERPPFSSLPADRRGRSGGVGRRKKVGR